MNLDPNRLSLLRSHGHSDLAYSTLQPGLSYFDRPEGYIAYSQFKLGPLSLNSVLGEPIAAPEHQETLLREFLERFPRSAFFHIGKHSANTLSELGLHTARMGCRYQVDLAQYRGSWHSHKSIRRACNQARKAGVTVREITFQRHHSHQLAAIYKEWCLRSRTGSQSQRFMTRPYNSENRERDTRLFAAFQNNTLVAFRLFDPLYSENKVTGYYASISAYGRTAAKGSSYLLADTAFRQFKHEGYNNVSLGCAPFDMTGIKSPNLLESLFIKSRPLLNLLYPFDGLSNHKRRFHGQSSPIYLASPNPLSLLHCLRAFSLTTGWKAFHKPPYSRPAPSL